jgi:hypothetical protein
VAGESPLDGHCCCHRIHGSAKHDQEAVTLRVDLLSAVGLEDRAQQLAILSQQAGIALTLLLQQAGTPLTYPVIHKLAGAVL